MRRLLLSLLGAIVSIAIAHAGKVTEQQALQKARQFITEKQFMTAKAKARGQEVKMQTLVKDGYYIFNVDNNGGFVIIAGDDRMPEVLGYAHKGALDVSNAPDGLKWLLGYYEEIAQHLDKSQQPTHHSTRTERAAISPLMATEWGQDYPYNAQCPTVNGKKTVTGCVATAMAQIMNYCRWPEDATSVIPSYTTASAQVTLPQLEPAQFNWTFLGSRQLKGNRAGRHAGPAV